MRPLPGRRESDHIPYGRPSRPSWRGPILLLLALWAVLALGCRREGHPDGGETPAQDNATAAAAVLPDGRSDRGLAGPVRRAFATFFHPAYDGSGTLEPYSSSVATFDREGRLQREDFYDAAGTLSARTIALRDADGRPSGEEFRSRSGALESRVVFSYDEDGRLARRDYRSADGTPTGYVELRYDGAGRVAQRSTRTDYGDGTFSITEMRYRYDEASLIVEETIIDEDLGGVALRIEHRYRDGRRIRSSDYQRGHWLEYLTFYRYDDAGNCAEEKSFQIPENEYGDSFASVTTAESLPPSFLSSVTTWSYEYYP